MFELSVCSKSSFEYSEKSIIMTIDNHDNYSLSFYIENHK